MKTPRRDVQASSPNHPIPLLLTSSVVAHDRSVRLTNTNERAHLALESIGQWLKIDPTLPLVLCDGSNFDFSTLVLAKFPNARIEYLFFDNDQHAVQNFGRGYGEGEIIRYALNHSRFIAEAGYFAKCTSKLWVNNFQECLAGWNDRLLCKGVFLDVFSPFKKTSFSYIDTRFYIASVPFYRQHFEDAHHRIGMRNGKFFSLEDCFHEIVLEQNLQEILMSVAPIIYGVGGGTGVHYKNTWIRQHKERLRLKLVNNNSAFHHLFCRI